MRSPGRRSGGKSVGRQAEPRDQVGRPLRGPGVEQLGGRRVGQLRAELAGQPVGQQVRDEQQPVRPPEQCGVPRAATSW